MDVMIVGVVFSNNISNLIRILNNSNIFENSLIIFVLIDQSLRTLFSLQSCLVTLFLVFLRSSNVDELRLLETALLSN